MCSMMSEGLSDMVTGDRVVDGAGPEHGFR